MPLIPESKTIAMADNGNQGDIRMWPSAEAANFVSDVANWALIGSLVVGVIATVLIVWMANVKEGYWESDRVQSRERIAELNAVASGANARAATAEQRTEEERIARLELQSRVEWRRLHDDQLVRIVSVLSAFPDLPYDRVIGAEAESLSLLSDLTKALTAPLVRWTAKASGGTISLRDSNGVSIGIFVGLNVQITFDPANEARFGAAARTLAKALSSEGIAATAEIDQEEAFPNDPRIHIKVGTKPVF